MEEKELKDMSCAELIEVINRLNRTAVRLEKENSELRESLQDRIIRIEKAGSIAEAAVSVNGVFEKAQSAADDYLLSVQDIKENTEEWAQQRRNEADREADEIVEKARRQSELLAEKTAAKARECLYDAVSSSRKMVAEAKLELETTKAECDALRAKTDSDIKEQWKAMEDKVAVIMERCADLKNMLESASDLEETMKELNV